MNLSLILDVLPRLADGMILTAKLTTVSIILGALIALPLSLMRSSSTALLSYPVLAYTFVFRGTPLLVQLFLVYYGTSQIDWIRSSAAWVILREPFWCALIAFSLNHAAYTTEILRGGIRAVPFGDVEAAKALGMSYALRTRRVVLPTAIRLALPAYANEIVLMLKASSLASTITLMELTGSARKIVAQTFSPYEVFISAALIYLGITLLISYVFANIERHLAKHQHRNAQSGSFWLAELIATIRPRLRGSVSR